MVSETVTTEEGAAPSQSAPGAAAGEAPDAGEPPLASERVAYTNDDYGFRVEHPSGYIVGAVSPEKLAPLDPKPVAAIAIMNPTLAASDVAELELPDFEIRIHPAEGAGSLQDWLTAHGFSNEGYLPAQPFQAANIAGLEVCVTTMLVPGCTYFVLGGEWVYQMAPASAEGEAIMHSFALVP